MVRKIVILVAVFILLLTVSRFTASRTSLKLISQVTYHCFDNRSIKARFFESSRQPSAPVQPPIPSGQVKLELSDGRDLTLPQTLSGSGIRYSNADESIIFWSKGDTAFINEGNRQTYSDCTQ